jgi:hypothetical protein
MRALRVPAFCDACGAIYPSSIDAQDSRHLRVTGCTSTCPVCGAEGHLPDGVFDFVEDSIRIISAPERTIDDLKRLTAIVERARLVGATSEAVSRDIREQVPEFGGLADILPKTPTEFYAALTLLVTLMMLLVQVVSGTSPKRDVTVNQVINNVYMQTERRSLGASEGTTPASLPAPSKVGRNARCPCGSGLKHKKCCGR